MRVFGFGFFLYTVLDMFSSICEKRNETGLVDKYRGKMEQLKFFLNSKGWDGRWYRRAFFPDGTPIGSMQCIECKIDAIAQSWAVISGAGEDDKVRVAMDSVYNNLVDRENMIIKLLTPPFNESEMEPGYIKAYLPGVRENGGQYTHGAIWVMIASAILGENDRASEYLRMIIDKVVWDGEQAHIFIYGSH